MSKVLITSGCSFSETISDHIDTWPRHLARAMPEYTHISKAMGSQGNGLISRSIIHACSENKDKDLLVGVVWSGPDRHDFYLKDNNVGTNEDMWMENPTGFTKNKRWVILNHNWRNHYAREYYGTFYDTVGATINTLEHILRTQWFLEQYGIKYFMSTYTADVLLNADRHADTKHLYDLINFDKFLPVDGLYEWVKDNIGEDGFPIKNDFHPSSFAHNEFMNKVILPFLGDKCYGSTAGSNPVSEGSTPSSSANQVIKKAGKPAFYKLKLFFMLVYVHILVLKI